MTSVQVLRAAMLSPTLKVRELPRPITGIASALDGTGLLMSSSRVVALVAGMRAVAPSAPSVFMNSRRENRVGNVITVINPLGQCCCTARQVYSRLRYSQSISPVPLIG